MLYAHQLPVPDNGPALGTGLPTPPKPAAEEGARHWLSRLATGHAADLVPLVAPPVEVTDAGLDPTQRMAVARALATPDVCLIEGLPGTGKSRVVAEIVTQAAAQGLRVLLLAPRPAAIDRVLEAVAGRDAVCPLRCLGRGGAAETLPPAVQALTFAERVRSLTERAVRDTRDALARGEEGCRRCRQEEGLWDRLRDLASRAQGLQEQQAVLAGRRAALGGDNQSPPLEVPGLEECTRAHQEAEAQREAELTEVNGQIEERRREMAGREPELEAQRPLAQAKQQGRWWTGRWWRATFRGNVVQRLAELEGLQKRAGEAASCLGEKIRQLGQDRAAAVEAFRAERERLIGAAIDSREATLRNEQELLRREWQAACSELDSLGERHGAGPPVEMSVPGVEAGRDDWQRRLEQEEQRLAFTREWADYLQGEAGMLADRLPDYVNLVAATTTGLADDEHFGDQADRSSPFDLLVLEEADQVTETEFLKAAQRARRWVLVGTCESVKAAAGTPPRRPVAAPAFFHHLWQQLHCDPRRLPYAWVRENDRLCCRLRPLAAEQRQWLESERVADFPEIELRILVLPRTPPLLAEVVFPPSMSIEQAKRYIYQELEELPVQAAGHSLCWSEDPQLVALQFTPADAAGETSVTLEQGVREIVGACTPSTCTLCSSGGCPGIAGHTSRLEFDRAAGWDLARAQTWVGRHLGVRDLGRTVRLDVPRRMCPGLAAFLSDILFEGGYRIMGGQDDGRSARGPAPVTFVPVPPLSAGSGPRRAAEAEGRNRTNGARVAALPVPRTVRGGAGLELDLTSPRHVDRLPGELRSGLPNQGFVNYLEAQTVVRHLEALAGTAPRPRVAVLALFPAQAELIRRLIRQSPRLAADATDIEVDVPAAFRQREAPVVLLSLTRSHSHRAVSFGDGPQTLALALTRARDRLVLFGDPGTLARRGQWEGPLDHLDAPTAERERQLVTRLLDYLHGRGRHPDVFQPGEGSRP
jgi:hypothetical protein